METLDWITVQGLTATGFHGVLPQERRDGQQFVVDLELGLQMVTDTDELADTVDYSVIAADVVQIIEQDPVNLIETLAARIAERCLAEPLVRVARVRVHKPQAPIEPPFTDVSVSITRSKQ